MLSADRYVMAVCSCVGLIRESTPCSPKGKQWADACSSCCQERIMPSGRSRNISTPELLGVMLCSCVNMCESMLCKSQHSLGYQNSPSTLLELRSPVFHHSTCQASWSLSFQGFFRLYFSSHCRSAGITNMSPHPVLCVCWGFKLRFSPLRSKHFTY